MNIPDVIYTSYDIGCGFWNRDITTMDLDSNGSRFYIDPLGKLYKVDYSYTQDYCNEKPGFKPNGTHGKVRPYYYTGQVNISPEKWTCYYSPYPVRRIHFKDGIIEKIVPLKKDE